MKKEFKKKLWMAWWVWSLAAFYYFSDYMARVAPGVMHQSLQTAFRISESGFGLLTYSFYLPYILMQIPVGLLVDRWSIRCLLSCMSLLTAIGCIVFGLSDNLMMAALGRVMIGFSAAFAFISALRIATVWFPPVMLGLLAGLTQALGMLGAAAGEAPVAWISDILGWRSCMYCLAGLFFVLAIFLFYFIQDHESMVEVKRRRNHEISILQSLKIVLGQKQIWINALYAGCLFGPIAVIGESYGPAFLQFGWHLSAHQAASAIGLIFMGWGVGGPLLGWLSDSHGKRKPWMILSAIFTLTFSIILVYFPLKNVLLTYLLFFCFGLTNSGVGLAYALSTELSSRSTLGTAIAFTNMASIFIGASLQPFVGHLVDEVAGIRSFHVEALNLADFQRPFMVLIFCAALALVLAFKLKETYCRNIEKI